MGFAEGVNARVNRDTLKAQKQAREQELEKQGYSFENGKMSVREGSEANAEQLAALEAVQLSKSLQAKLAAQDSDRAFEDFAYTGDAGYLQGALDKNEVLKKSWGERGVNLVTNIDFENDLNILANAGLQPEHYDTPDKRSILKKNMYKMHDGKAWQVGLLNNAVAETGTLDRMGERRGGVLQQNFEEFGNLLRGPKVSPNTVEGHKYESEINAAAAKYPNVPPNLIAAQMHKESRGNPTAKSPKGAQGLMQIMPDTAKHLGVADVNDPAQNIEGGFKYMDELITKYNGNIKLALAAYNAGPGNVDKYGDVPPFGETQDYVKTVLANFDSGEQYYQRTGEGTAETILNHYRSIANAKQGTTNENVDQGVRNDTRKLDQADRSLDQTDEANKLKLMEIGAKLKVEGNTANQKDLNAAAEITNEMLTEFGGEEGFNNMDFSNPSNYNKAYKHMVKIEKLEGTTLDESDKKSIRDLRPIIALSGNVEKLTSADTGIIDNKLGAIRTYLDDTVGGVKAKAAHQGIINLYIKAMSGTAVSSTELDRQIKAMGTLDKKLAPALQQFQTLLMQTKEELAATSSLMNPYSAKIRLGASTQQLDQVMKNIDAVIARTQGLDQPILSEEEKAARPSLDSLWGG